MNFNLTLRSKNITKRLYACTLDLSGPDIKNEELEAVPEASSLQMVSLLMSVAGSWWIPLLASIYFPFPSLYEVKEKAKSLAHWWLLAGGSVAVVVPCVHAGICSYSEGKQEIHSLIQSY